MKKFIMIFFLIGIVYGQTDTTFTQEATRFDGKKTSVKNSIEFNGVGADSVFGNNVYVLNLFYLINRMDSIITYQKSLIDSLNKSNDELREINSNTDRLTSIGHAVISVLTSATQFSNIACKRLMIINDSASPLYIGTSGVSTSNYGLVINSNMASGWIEVDNLNDIYGISMNSISVKVLYQN